MLEVHGLEKRYAGIAVVRGFSCKVAAGEMVALIGPNGAGKSTCFNMLGGQIRPDAGTVVLDGRVITGFSAARIWQEGVGRTFQIARGFASMTVRENVQMALIAASGGVWRGFRAARHLHVSAADSLLAGVEIADQADRPAAVLAYGDVKRLELAMALASGPKLLLMDEPTAGMAQAERLALMGLVRRLATERGLAVLFTEHDMDVVFGTADRIFVLEQGAVIAEGGGDEIRANARVRAVYLGTGLTSGGH